MERLQGAKWHKDIRYIRLGKTIFSTNGNVRIEFGKYYHWCSDYEKQAVFNYIREHKDIFQKDDRTFRPVKGHCIHITDILKNI